MAQAIIQVNNFIKELIMKAESGDKVKVDYTLKINNDEVVETSVGKMPLEFTIGEKCMIPEFEQGIVGMNIGESKTINIPSAEAYGPRQEKLIFEFDRSRAPESFEPQIGQQIQMHRPDGKTFYATVISTTEKGYNMDANHPLADKDLVFDLKLLEIEKLK